MEKAAWGKEQKDAGLWNQEKKSRDMLDHGKGNIATWWGQERWATLLTIVSWGHKVNLAQRRL